MRCFHLRPEHAPEDCPAVRKYGSGPAGREVERADRSGALPLAQPEPSKEQIAESPEESSGPARREVQDARDGAAGGFPKLDACFPASAGDEYLDRLESALEGRGETKFTPAPLEPSPFLQPILLRRPRRSAVHRETDDQLIEPLREACEMALRQGVDVVEVDRTTLFELLLHIGAVEAGLRWASENGPCPGEGPCAWHEGLWEAVEEVKR